MKKDEVTNYYDGKAREIVNGVQDDKKYFLYEEKVAFVDVAIREAVAEQKERVASYITSHYWPAELECKKCECGHIPEATIAAKIRERQ